MSASQEDMIDASASEFDENMAERFRTPKRGRRRSRSSSLWYWHNGRYKYDKAKAAKYEDKEDMEDTAGDEDKEGEESTDAVIWGFCILYFFKIVIIFLKKISIFVSQTINVVVVSFFFVKTLRIVFHQKKMYLLCHFFLSIIYELFCVRKK